MHKFRVGELIEWTARLKSHAARARFDPLEATTEPCRAVYLDACSTIAASFAADGFRFAKSGPAMRRRAGDFDHHVSFQSSMNNVRGQYIALWIHVWVSARKLKAWRRQHRADSVNDFVAGGQIGNLEVPTGWAEWDLASTGRRSAQVRDAISAIRRVGLPFLDQFRDPTSALEAASQWPAPGLSIEHSIEMCLWLSDMPRAQQLLWKYFATWPDRLPTYRQALVEFARSVPLDDLWDAGSARDMAKLTVIYGLRPPTAA